MHLFDIREAHLWMLLHHFEECRSSGATGTNYDGIYFQVHCFLYLAVIIRTGFPHCHILAQHNTHPSAVDLTANDLPGTVAMIFHRYSLVVFWPMIIF